MAAVSSIKPINIVQTGQAWSFKGVQADEAATLTSNQIANYLNKQLGVSCFTDLIVEGLEKIKTDGKTAPKGKDSALDYLLDYMSQASVDGKTLDKTWFFNPAQLVQLVSAINKPNNTAEEIAVAIGKTAMPKPENGKSAAPQVSKAGTLAVFQKEIINIATEPDSAVTPPLSGTTVPDLKIPGGVADTQLFEGLSYSADLKSQILAGLLENKVIKLSGSKYEFDGSSVMTQSAKDHYGANLKELKEKFIDKFITLQRYFACKGQTKTPQEIVTACMTASKHTDYDPSLATACTAIKINGVDCMSGAPATFSGNAVITCGTPPLTIKADELKTAWESWKMTGSLDWAEFLKTFVYVKQHFKEGDTPAVQPPLSGAGQPPGTLPQPGDTSSVQSFEQRDLVKFEKKGATKIGNNFANGKYKISYDTTAAKDVELEFEVTEGSILVKSDEQKRVLAALTQLATSSAAKTLRFLCVDNNSVKPIEINFYARAESAGSQLPARIIQPSQKQKDETGVTPKNTKGGSTLKPLSGSDPAPHEPFVIEGPVREKNEKGKKSYIM